MQRNEYRRALIMLRSLLNGYSGHARIEIRTLTGNLNIRAAIPSGAQSVRAALVGKRSALYYAYPLGSLRRDMRGQAGLSVNFDPRDIGGRTLDAYSLLALVTVNNGVCELSLVGNLNGSTENDWSRVRDVVCALYAPQPRPEDELIQTPYSRSLTGEGDTAPTETENEEAREGAEFPLDFGTLQEEDRESPQDDSAGEINDDGLVWDLSQPEGENSDMDEPASDSLPELLNREGWNFAKIPMPAGCGYAHVYVGTPECGSEVCVALPGMFSAEPPAGLDDYSWSGGSGTGYWVKCYSIERAE